MDILQVRNVLILVMDYKPEAHRINAVNQLTVYALALASRTKLAVKDFKCAWFDEKNYYEFFPLHAVYKGGGMWRLKMADKRKSFSRKISGFEGRPVLCLDLKDLERMTGP